MGIEYELHVPPSARQAVAEALKRELQPLLQRFDPKASEPLPTVSAKPITEGLYVCDHLTDPTVAAQVIRRLIDLLLGHSPEVKIVEP